MFIARYLDTITKFPKTLHIMLKNISVENVKLK